MLTVAMGVTNAAWKPLCIILSVSRVQRIQRIAKVGTIIIDDMHAKTAFQQNSKVQQLPI